MLNLLRKLPANLQTKLLSILPEKTQNELSSSDQNVELKPILSSNLSENQIKELLNECINIEITAHKSESDEILSQISTLLNLLKEKTEPNDFKNFLEDNRKAMNLKKDAILTDIEGLENTLRHLPPQNRSNYHANKINESNEKLKFIDEKLSIFDKTLNEYNTSFVFQPSSSLAGGNLAQVDRQL